LAVIDLLGQLRNQVRPYFAVVLAASHAFEMQDEGTDWLFTETFYKESWCSICFGGPVVTNGSLGDENGEESGEAACMDERRRSRQARRGRLSADYGRWAGRFRRRRLTSARHVVLLV
jgi:hypothetical protein